MAAGTPVITWSLRGPKTQRYSRGLAMGTGTITLSANSTFQTSIIERSFRDCHNIQVQMSGYLVNWTASSIHKAGLLRALGQKSTTDGGFTPQPVAAGTVGTFTAFGI